MPLTAKGTEVMAAMVKQYGAETGERVFYASKAAGKITGVDSEDVAVDVAISPAGAAAMSHAAKLDVALAKAAKMDGAHR